MGQGRGDLVAPEHTTRTSKRWLFAAALALLLALLVRSMAGAAIANAAQVGLIKVAAGGPGSAQAIAARFGSALSVWPESVAAGRGIWRSLAVAGLQEESEAAMEHLLARRQEDDTAAMLLGLRRLGRGDRDGAFDAWRSLGARVGGLALYLDSAMEQQEGELRLPVFAGESVSVDPLVVRELAEAGILTGYSDVWLHLIIGDYYGSESADHDMALYWYLAGRQAFPYSFIPPARAAQLLSQMDRLEESRALYEEAFAKCPWPRDDYLVRIGQSHMQENRPDLASLKFERAVSISPDNAQWRVFLGDAYQALGDPERAQEQFEFALHLAPDMKTAKHRLERLLER
ncbi:MAG TPA: tetratricopeptide repeat protein [Anaerolineae bacterium]|nr:tetratricopeptide repeat protein [Anaerolineae bacterium]